jgi:hypothetical protein
MAEEKKGFILYADQMTLFNQLPNDKAGELIKHIFAYVNDENPITEDLIINLAFTPIKQQFKRDLEKWETTREGRSKAGKASAVARANKKQQALTNSTNVNNVQQASTNPTVTVNDNVTVNVNDNVKVNDIIIKKEKGFVFRKALIDFGFDKTLVEDWLKVRKNKKATNTETAFNGFINQIEKTTKYKPNEILKICVEKSWGGFKAEWLNDNDNKKETFSESIMGKEKHDRILAAMKGDFKPTDNNLIA